MQCLRCGERLAAGAPACTRCGTAQHLPPNWATGPPRPWLPPAPGGPRLSQTRVVVATVLAVALVVIGGGVAALLWLWPGDEPPPESTQVAASTTPTDFTDFAAVYEDVNDGVGQVLVQTCGDGSFTGTAFLVSPTLMATAAHVIENASSLQVELDNVVLPADVYGVDLSHDLALLELGEQVDGHVFAFAPQDPDPGTRIAAIGFPLGEPKTLTEGTVSGLDRHIDTRSGSYDGLLQTDTAINPGNSGGPLLDITGQVVGVADAIRTDAQGIGFAVPATTASGLTSTVLQTQELATCP